jgi:molybdopterin-guanine dinucleotide biosynthesis adapter protein
MKVFGIAGWKNSGKTTLVERLVAEFVRRGIRVATVKHAHHGFEIDREGTDSFRHREAGASQTAVVSSRRVAIMQELREEAEPTLADILARLEPCDLVLVEGFKRDPIPKIELRRTAARDTAPLGADVPGIVAVAADHDVAGETRPLFRLDDAAAIADFIESTLELQGSAHRAG